jgi:CP family cyanate transporter-like MFS transporter
VPQAVPVRPRTAIPLVLVAAIVLVAVNLRPAVAGLSPILAELRAGLGLSATAVSLLTTIPVLCFGLLAPLAPPLRARLGEERAIAAGLVLLITGLVVRAAWPGSLLLPATALTGAGIALGNVLLPSLIKRRLPHRVGPMMSVYSTALSIGPALAAGLTVPVYDLAGGSIRVALAVWAIPAAAALALWLPQAVRPAEATAGPRLGGSPVWRSALAWQVTLTMGLQSLGFYATLAWLPSFYRDQGVAPARAGALLSLASFAGIAAALAAPAVAARTRDQRVALTVALALVMAGLAGVLLAPPAFAVLWVVVLGLGQSAIFALALLLVVVRAADPATSARLSGMAQTVGYLLAAAGPLAVGLLHDATGGWTVPFWLLLALTAVQVPIALGAGRDKVVGP